MRFGSDTEEVRKKVTMEKISEEIVDFPSIWTEITGIEVESMVHTMPDNLKNQNFANETSTLFHVLKENCPEIKSAMYFCSGDKECFIISYFPSEDIMVFINGMYKRHMMPNVETFLADKTLALFIAKTTTDR